MRKASLGTLFLTVFLDLLGFGLVIPFLPGVARALGASDLVATLLAAAFSLMQFLFVPVWGRVSDRVGRRPVLLFSIAVTALGMLVLGLARDLTWLFIARLGTGIGTANIAVAQAYIADVTTPENRARGMGLIGMGFGLGFIFGPAIGGLLGQVGGRTGAAAAFLAAGLSVLNLVLAFFFVPESLPKEARNGPPTGHRRRSVLDVGAVRRVASVPGLGLAVFLSFWVVFWFAGMENTFRLYTEDAFGLTVAGTGWVFTFVGVIAAIVQGGLISRLTRRFGERRLVPAGNVSLALGFLALALAPVLAAPWGLVGLYAAAGLIAIGSGLNTPSLSSYASRQTDAGLQGLTLGVLQSMGALARVLGPATAGLLYQFVGHRAPYFAGALGFAGAAALATSLPRLRPVATAQAAVADVPQG